MSQETANEDMGLLMQEFGELEKMVEAYQVYIEESGALDMSCLHPRRSKIILAALRYTQHHIEVSTTKFIDQMMNHEEPA